MFGIDPGEIQKSIDKFNQQLAAIQQQNAQILAQLQAISKTLNALAAK